MKCQFNFDHLENIFLKLKTGGHQSIFFSEAFNSGLPKKAVILRHDLDQDLETALVIAQLESQYELKATFFVWLESPFYNPFEPRNAETIHKILNLGHAVGLHIEVNKEDVLGDLPQIITVQAKLLESFFAVDCQTVSFHRPNKELLNYNQIIGNRLNAYAPYLIDNFHYVSDSRGIWQEECVCKQVNQYKYPYLYLLLHPLWWGNEDLAPNSRVQKYIQHKIGQLEDNCRLHI